MDIMRVNLASADLVDVPLPVWVPHRDTGLDVVLDPGQQVVLSDLDGELHGGLVLDVLGSPLDPVYSVRVGARLPVDVAAERMTDAELPPDRAETHDLIDLLGEARALWRERQAAPRADDPVGGSARAAPDEPVSGGLEER